MGFRVDIGSIEGSELYCSDDLTNLNPTPYTLNPKP